MCWVPEPIWCRSGLSLCRLAQLLQLSLASATFSGAPVWTVEEAAFCPESLPKMAPEHRSHPASLALAGEPDSLKLKISPHSILEPLQQHDKHPISRAACSAYVVSATALCSCADICLLQRITSEAIFTTKA